MRPCALLLLLLAACVTPLTTGKRAGLQPLPGVEPGLGREPALRAVRREVLLPPFPDRFEAPPRAMWSVAPPRGRRRPGAVATLRFTPHGLLDAAGDAGAIAADERIVLGSPVQRPGHPVALPGHSVARPVHAVSRPGHAVTRPGHAIRRPGHAIGRPGHAIGRPGHTVGRPGHAVGRPGHAVGRPGHAVGPPRFPVGRPGHPLTRPGHAVTPPKTAPARRTATLVDAAGRDRSGGRADQPEQRPQHSGPRAVARRRHDGPLHPLS
ncbi:MAG: hypothetical protein ACE5JG_11970 [Planctomycetota bacterium]